MDEDEIRRITRQELYRVLRQTAMRGLWLASFGFSCREIYGYLQVRSLPTIGEVVLHQLPVLMVLVAQACLFGWLVWPAGMGRFYSVVSNLKEKTHASKSPRGHVDDDRCPVHSGPGHIV